MNGSEKLTVFSLHSSGERITPIEEIPVDERLLALLPCGRKQLIDRRRCYTYHPEYSDNFFPNGAYLECINLAVDELHR